jgi:OmpA-OmpF porin, OOP family
MITRNGMSVLLLAVAVAVSVTAAAEDHPLVSAYAGSQQNERKVDEYNEYQRIIGQIDGLNTTEKLAGRLTRLRYRNPPDRSTLEIIRNYREALEGQGLTVDYECSGRKECGHPGVGHKQYPGWNSINGINLGAVNDARYFTGKLAYNDAQAYVSVAANPHVTYVHVLEVAAMQTGLVVADASALSDALDRDGRVVVDGIYFDTGSATLRGESDAALTQVAELLKQRSSLKLHVVGHTDNTGTFASNMALSQNRARSVAGALVERYGIAASRLAGHGVGPLAPAASNGGESGRAKNRRVEVVVQ